MIIPAPRVLLINPNTTPSITDLVLKHVRRVVPDSIELRAVTGRFGAAYIASEAAFAIGGHAALDAYAQHGADCDAVLLACFGDPGLLALREVASVPVVGLAQCSMARAQVHGPFAIVTGGQRWRPMLEAFATQIGVRSALAAIETVAITGAEIAADPDSAIELLAQACVKASHAQVDGRAVQTVILGGAGLAGLAARVQDRVAIPVWDSVEVGAQTVTALLLGDTAGVNASVPTQPGLELPSVGLSVALERLLAKKRHN